jgi:hypothetical protein
MSGSRRKRTATNEARDQRAPDMVDGAGPGDAGRTAQTTNAPMSAAPTAADTAPTTPASAPANASAAVPDT